MPDDERTHEVLKTDPTSKYKKELVGKLSRLKQESKITQEDYDWLYPSHGRKCPQDVLQSENS